MCWLPGRFPSSGPWSPKDTVSGEAAVDHALVRGRIPDGCDRGTRARLLMGIADAWRRITGAAEDEVIVSARDWSWRADARPVGG